MVSSSSVQCAELLRLAYLKSHNRYQNKIGLRIRERDSLSGFPFSAPEYVFEVAGHDFTENEVGVHGGVAIEAVLPFKGFFKVGAPSPLGDALLLGLLLLLVVSVRPAVTRRVPVWGEERGGMRKMF